MMLKRLINLSVHLRRISTQLNVTNNHYKFRSPTTGNMMVVSNHRVEADKSLHNQWNTVLVPIKVLECLLETNSQSIRGKNIIDAIDSLGILCEKNLYRGEKQRIIEKMLYTLVSVHKDKIQVNEAIEILKNIMKISISESSEVINIILNIINNSIDDLEFKDYNFISDILKSNFFKPKERDLIKTINDKLKTHFTMKMATEFDADNLDLLTEIFKYASNNLSDKKLFEIIVESLKSDNFKSVPIKNAICIMKSLCTMFPLTYKWDELLPRIHGSLINNIDKVKTKDIKLILHKMEIRIRRDRKVEYYNAALLDCFAQQLILSDIGFDSAINCLRRFLSMKHIPKNLLSYISAKHYEKKGIYDRTNVAYLEKLLCLVNGLAYLKYKPIFWEEIYSVLKTPTILTFSDEMLVNYALHLSCLDCYDLTVLERVYKAQYRHKAQKFLHWRLLHLWLNIKCNSNYSGPLPPQEMIDSFDSLDRIKNCPLLPSLKVILPDVQRYVKTNVRTKLHHQIDHIVAYKGKNKPVAISDNDDETNGVQYFEELRIPENTEIVALLFIKRWWYLANVDEILGPYQTYIKSLETFIRHVVVIPEQVWFQLPEDSRPEYLKNAINTKLYSAINENC